MSIRPSQGDCITLKGTFDFCGTPPNGLKICDSYELEIIVPGLFPQAIPTVKELGGKIPSDGKYHVNDDKSLCLGSPLRLRHMLSAKPTLSGFVESCLVPYLYGVSCKLQHGVEFPFGELAHGEAGIIEDYLEMFGLKSKSEVQYALELLGTKKRIANKLPCPCNCGQRLGRCRLHQTLNGYRKLASRSWFNTHRKRLGAGI